MNIESPRDWREFAQDAAANACRLVAHPHAAVALAALFRGWSQEPPTGGYVVAIGPEGGFNEVEVTLARDAGWTAVDLGPRILRVETAAIKLAACAALTMPTCGGRQ